MTHNSHTISDPYTASVTLSPYKNGLSPLSQNRDRASPSSTQITCPVTRLTRRWLCENANKFDAVPLPQSVDHEDALTCVFINRINVAPYPSALPQRPRFRAGLHDSAEGPQMSAMIKIRRINCEAVCLSRAAH